MTGLAWKRVASGQVGPGQGDCGDCWRPKRVWAMILGLGLSPVSSLNDVHVYALLCCVAGNARTPRHLKRRRQQRQPATKRNPTSHCGRRRWPGAAGWWSRFTLENCDFTCDCAGRICIATSLNVSGVEESPFRHWYFEKHSGDDVHDLITVTMMKNRIQVILVLLVDLLTDIGLLLSVNSGIIPILIWILKSIFLALVYLIVILSLCFAYAHIILALIFVPIFAMEIYFLFIVSLHLVELGLSSDVNDESPDETAV
uniref:HDC06210 n=1 Tax=Drosophila melanogaster TaxID=7227 RepID=Q6IGI5_DROME|nr:TPA_inf: HDC06210 [Drosophila melanogaster]